MNVVHVLWSQGFGGIERLVLDLVRAQQREDAVSPALLFGKGGGTMAPEFEALGGWQMVAGLSGGLDLSPDKRRRITAYVEAFDVAHFHSFNPLLARAAVQSGTRIIYTEHGNFGFGRKTTVRDRLRNRMLRHFLNRHVEAITFNSVFTMRTAEARYGLQSVARHLVYNGVSQDRKHAGHVDENIREMLRGKFVVGTSSRLAGVKRVDRLIEGFAQFQDGREAVLLIVGDGVERGALEARVDQLGIRAKTLFAGYQREVQAYQAAMDVCVVSSEGEAFGLIAVETLALGKPTVVFADGGGICEIVAGLDPGDVVESPDALAERLAYYYENEAARSRHREARVRTAASFSIEKMAAAFQALYFREPVCAA